MLCVRGGAGRERRQFYLLPNSASSFSRGEFISYDGERVSKRKGEAERLPQWEEHFPKKLQDGWRENDIYLLFREFIHNCHFILSYWDPLGSFHSRKKCWDGRKNDWVPLRTGKLGEARPRWVGERVKPPTEEGTYHIKGGKIHHICLPGLIQYMGLPFNRE